MKPLHTSDGAPVVARVSGAHARPRAATPDHPRFFAAPPDVNLLAGLPVQAASDATGQARQPTSPRFREAPPQRQWNIDFAPPPGE